MMKNLFFIFGIVLTLNSCVKEEIVPQQPIVYSTPGDTTIHVDSEISLEGQTWVITKVLNTDLSYETRSDTMVFINNVDYKFNGFKSRYGFTSTPTSFKLTLYDTSWGHIGGSMYNYNIVSGTIDGLDFYDIFDSNRKVKLWMKKI